MNSLGAFSVKQPPMATFTKYKSILYSLGVTASGFAAYITVNQDKNKVFASWTSNYEPSFCSRWDENWDQ